MAYREGVIPLLTNSSTGVFLRLLWVFYGASRSLNRMQRIERVAISSNVGQIFRVLATWVRLSGIASVYSSRVASWPIGCNTEFIRQTTSAR